MIGIDEFLCGEHEVFENRRTRTGRMIPIKITIVPAIDPDETLRQAPVFALAGGPGESAHNTSLGAYMTLRPAMRTRDLVIADIRGTGGSNPLTCAPLGPPERIQSWMYYIIPLDEAAHCAEALSSRADLTQYTTSNAADDLNEVREALGYELFALWGGSYGTLLGQEIIRRHERFVDAAVFIGIAPPDMYAPMGFARSLETTRERLVADCRENEQCNDAYPDFGSDLEAMLARVREGPITATVVSPITQKREEVTLEYGDFVMGVRFVLYNAAAAASLPAWAAKARGGDYAPVMQAVANAVYGVRQILHYGLFLSMRCAEDLPYVDVQAERADAAGTMLGMYRMERELENCTVWARGHLYSDRHSPVEADTPVLLLSGSEDPVTPPRYGAQVASTMPNSLHVVFSNRGHGFFDPRAIECLYTIVEPFLSRSSAEGVDMACAAEIERLPFRVSGS
jgi:pimeloyl-ACP methyl ester carboxylesterase